MSACTSHRSIFDLCPNDEILNGLKEVNSILKQTVDHEPTQEENKSRDDDREGEGSLVRDVSDKMTCLACKCSFTNREDQMEHYKLDWHRFNLRQKMEGLSPVTVEEFERKTGAGDMSSISGSESDSEEGDSDSDYGGTSSNVTGTDNESSSENSLICGRLSSKVVFQNSAGQYLSVHRCILQGKRNEEIDLVLSLKAVNKKTVWVILMTGGGHFAGAVFRGKEVIQHKTFHRYTVRAKRGTAQGLRDAQNRSHAPKSAGAALRRYNEAALVKDIQDILVSWVDHLKEASAIFVRSPSYNKSIFFGGRTAALDKKDSRIHSIPFATRRATFREVQRVHEVLGNIQVYGNETDMSFIFSQSKKMWKKAVKVKVQPTTDQDKENSCKTSSGEEEESGAVQLEMEELSLTTLDLRESEVYPSKRKRRKNKNKDGKMQTQDLDSTEEHTEEQQEAAETVEAPQDKKSKRRRRGQKKKELKDTVDDTWEYSVRDALFTACKIGDVDGLQRLLNDPKPVEKMGTAEETETSNVKTPLIFLNKPIDSSGFTLLHVASTAAQKEVVKCLLDIGADPACRDNKGQTPYNVAPEKDTRNVFRKFMGENPDKYDYSKAQIPGPLTAEIESKKLEKKKAQKAQKKQREKEQKEEKKKQEMEAEEKKRFAALSDREKRALAAERRLAEQAAATGVSISNAKRCWMCGESLLGKIPFQYLDFTFCSPRCVQQHRKANAK
ncbi:ankyrin repeat and zinc finger domain-containing protein 1 [Periophthalmus magnuspinnatus]|uniref:ankyrin repeat and zinc finger domain-containing protein 1 n=1 Tax=Periophthalmus magnuspinnatus TaxID=409849 RepID=UPI00145B5BD6|nr:ankyrin repeat and zinc finger domain-containing protein 1 [Periophthalmus magnuspinnatus]